MSNSSNVHALPTRLERVLQQIKTCYAFLKENERTARANWVKGTFELADYLADAREQFPSDHRFSAWLQTNVPKLKEADRIALINIATHKREANIILWQTKSRSWQLIWRNEIQPRLLNAKGPAGKKANQINKKAAETKPKTEDEKEAERRRKEWADELTRRERARKLEEDLQRQRRQEPEPDQPKRKLKSLDDYLPELRRILSNIPTDAQMARIDDFISACKSYPDDMPPEISDEVRTSLRLISRKFYNLSEQIPGGDEDA